METHIEGWLVLGVRAQEAEEDIRVEEWSNMGYERLRKVKRDRVWGRMCMVYNWLHTGELLNK